MLFRSQHAKHPVQWSTETSPCLLKCTAIPVLDFSAPASQTIQENIFKFAKAEKKFIVVDEKRRANKRVSMCCTRRGLVLIQRRQMTLRYGATTRKVLEPERSLATVPKKAGRREWHNWKVIRVYKKTKRALVMRLDVQNFSSRSRLVVVAWLNSAIKRFFPGLHNRVFVLAAWRGDHCLLGEWWRCQDEPDHLYTRPV